MGKLTLKCTSIKIIYEHLHLLGYDTVQLYLPNINYIPKESNFHSQCHEKFKPHQITQINSLYPGYIDNRYASIVLQTTGTVCHFCV